jgi:prepilin-type N-terminal cleavage/methylation domain-containing protein
MNKKLMRGFTLIELLVVISIIGILASMIAVSLNTANQKAKDAKVLSDTRNLMSAVELFKNDSATNAVPTQAENLTILKTNGFIGASTDVSGYAYTDCTGGSYLIVGPKLVAKSVLNKYFWAQDGSTGYSTSTTLPTCTTK